MTEKKKILTVMPVLKGGGAERVSSMLTNEFDASGYETEYLLTSSDEDEIINRDLNSDIPVTVLRKLLKPENALQKLIYKLLRIFTSVVCRLFEAVKLDVPAAFSYLSFVSEYRREIKAMREKLKREPATTVVVFLQPSIPIVLLAARGLPNKIIISERGDPKRLIKSRYGYKFIEKFYPRADSAVFQTDDAKNTYPGNISVKGRVIFNPINGSLPEAYHGGRNKNITTFCRISWEKNLQMLIRAFSIIHDIFPDYYLRIIGQTSNAQNDVLIDVENLINELNLNGYVKLLPFISNVHSEIIQDAVYVNSSDHEGMSNAMLEAMAIGMPVVCTDCPIGGAAAVINHKENGMLTRVGDYEDFAKAIIEVIENPELSAKLSANAAKIREELSLENIAKQWMELF